MNLRIGLVVVSLILSILIGLALKGDGSKGPSGGDGKGKKIVIGLSLDTLAEERWQKDRDTFIAEAEKLGAEVQVLSANSDTTKQTGDVRALITRQVDALVIVPFDGEAMGASVTAAAEAGIPTIAYDRLITNTDDLLCYLSFDNVKVGQAQAQYLVDALKDKAKARIARVYGSPTDNNARLFKQGQDEILQPLIDAGKIEVVHEAWATGWRAEEATRIIEAALRNTNGQIDGILASNDGTAGGAIAALPESLMGKVVVTGQDAELEALRRIALDRQSMTIYKPISELAKLAADLAVKAARREVIVANNELDNGNVIVPSIFAEIFTVTKDNIVDTVVKDDYVDYDSIYRDVPESSRPTRPQ